MRTTDNIQIAASRATAAAAVHFIDSQTTIEENTPNPFLYKMTSPSETAVNGTQHNHADPAKTSSSPSQQTSVRPKTNGVNGFAKANGHTTDDGTVISNGEGSNATTDSHPSITTPATSMSGSQADIMEQIPSGDSQQSQSEHGDQSEDDSHEPKRDLYVGNLYNSPASKC